jgi:hypothetical protein
VANVFEIVTYTVTELKSAQSGRNKARKAVSTYAGFVDWRSFTGLGDEAVLVDIVEWDNLENALNAQKLFLTDPEMTDFLAFFGKTRAMVHATENGDS